MLFASLYCSSEHPFQARAWAAQVHALAAGLAPVLVATLGPEAAAVCAAHRSPAGAACVDVSATLAAEEAECAARAQRRDTSHTLYFSSFSQNSSSSASAPAPLSALM